MAKSFNNIRVGKSFRLQNYGEISEFTVEEILSDGNCRLKDIHTLEQYHLYQLIEYGQGEDFEIQEIAKG